MKLNIPVGTESIQRQTFSYVEAEFALSFNMFDKYSKAFFNDEERNRYMSEFSKLKTFADRMMRELASDITVGDDNDMVVNSPELLEFYRVFGIKTSELFRQFMSEVISKC